MSINVYAAIQREYELKRDIALSAYENEKKSIYEANPKLRDLDMKIKKLGIKAARLSLISVDKDKQKELKTIFEKIEKLKKEKNEILKSNLTEISPKYECEKCKDTGYIMVDYIPKMCTCMKQKLIDTKYNKSNLNRLTNDTFENFNLNLYSNKKNAEKYKKDESPRENIIKIKEYSQKFIDNFDNPDEKNLLFLGTPGTGKTFMSGCIANSLINKGYNVLYKTAPLLIDTVFDYKYNQNNSTSSDVYNDIFNVDLLIIDDLGTENPTQAKFFELFTIINSRLLNPNKKTIISSNFSLNELQKNYDDRLISRLIGNFAILKFYGEDIRLKNN